MSKFSKQVDRKEGINKTSIPKGMFQYIKGFNVLRLKEGEKIRRRGDDCETGLVIFSGVCDITVGGKVYSGIGERKDVFSGVPTGVYIPRDTPYMIAGHDVEIGMCLARCDKQTEFAVIKPQDIKVMQVGKNNWQREVRMIIGQNSPSVNMLLGETFNPAGNWSGTPPHKHEQNNLPVESLHEELYYFKTDKPQGFGIEKFYSPERNVDELISLSDNTVTLMPWGYHQIVAGPEYNLYYMFFLAGDGKQLTGYVDQDHKWIIG